MSHENSLRQANALADEIHLMLETHEPTFEIPYEQLELIAQDGLVFRGVYIQDEMLFRFEARHKNPDASWDVEWLPPFPPDPRFANQKLIEFCQAVEPEAIECLHEAQNGRVRPNRFKKLLAAAGATALVSLFVIHLRSKKSSEPE